MVWNLNTIILIAGVTMTFNAWGYPPAIDYNGQLSRWELSEERPAVVLRIANIEQVPESLRQRVEQAAALWSKVSSSHFRFTTDHYNPNEDVLVEFKDSLSNSSASGVAYIDSYERNGSMRHCEISVDINQSGLAKTILHELGHCAGLGHSVVPDAIMSYRDSHNKFALDTDDAAALSRLYPLNLQHSKLPPGCAIGSSSAPVSFKQHLFLLLCIFAPIGIAFAQFVKIKHLKNS